MREPLTLAGFIPEWEELAATAMEPNIFYEHWMLLPALRASDPDRDICFVLVLIRDPARRHAPPKLCGLFPLELTVHGERPRHTAWSAWRPGDCPLATPLIRAGKIHDCMIELLSWLGSGEADAELIELAWPFCDRLLPGAMKALPWEDGLIAWGAGSASRGRLRRTRGACSGLLPPVPESLRRQLERKERQLARRGRIEHLTLQSGGDVARWIEDFLRIEAGTWRGRRGMTPDYRARYFENVVGRAFERGQLLMVGIDLDGQPIARACTLIAGGGSFSLGTTFDERFARFSPGLLLELDSVRLLDALPGVDWIDACSARQGLLINRLSNERRTVRDLTIRSG